MGKFLVLLFYRSIMKRALLSLVVLAIATPANSAIELKQNPKPKPGELCAAEGPGSMYGHLAYSEAPRGDLVSVSDGIQLRSAAARSFRAMQNAAAAEGVRLVPLSGFRDIETQHYLFYDIAAQRGQTPEERARVSAPPGHSEHHTGYTIDIGDAAQPGADFQQWFDSTAAGIWLFTHAYEFGFELSFGPGHPCVSYEPWHWRWVGNAESQAIFDRARSQSY